MLDRIDSFGRRLAPSWTDFFFVQQQTYEMATDGFRLRLVALGLAFVGFAFVAVAIWAFVAPASADVRAGRTVIFTATKVRVTWSHVYAFRDHPVDFATAVLTKILGGIGFGALGLLVSCGCLLRAFGPADFGFGQHGKRIAAACVYVSGACIGLYFLLQVFPYLLRYGLLP